MVVPSEAATAEVARNASPLLADLTFEQGEAVTARVTPLCIIAGAGSGKTRVLTRRIAWHAEQGLVDPRRVLALTFTRRAARELRQRLHRLGLRDAVKAGTFHAVALAQLRRSAGQSGRRVPEILADRIGLLAELRPRTPRTELLAVAAEIGWAMTQLVPPERYAEAAGATGRQPKGGPNRTASLYGDYEAAKRRRRLLDFNDVLTASRTAMLRDPERAAAHRWHHQHLLVDEFQDVNPLQFELLRSWIGPDSTVTVVGDPEQAIYGWNGADPNLIRDIADHLPGCAIVMLRTNFRSTPDILEAAAKVAGMDSQPAARPSSGLVPAITRCSAGAEAATLARAVRTRRGPGAPWRHQAVLARTNAQLEPLRKALEDQDIPVVTRAAGDLANLPEIKILLESWSADESLATVVAELRLDPGSSSEFAAVAGSAHPSGAAWPASPPAAAPMTASEASLAALRSRLIEEAEAHLALDPGATVRSFRTALGSGERWSPWYDGDDGVALMTFHAAKGLEWPVVHLVGIEEGFVPMAGARRGSALAEERRLLYVAVTRARDELHIMWCHSRPRRSSDFEAEPSRSGYRKRTRDRPESDFERKPSRWLKDVEAAAADLAPANPKAALAQVRRQLAGSTEAKGSGATGSSTAADGTARITGHVTADVTADATARAAGHGGDAELRMALGRWREMMALRADVEPHAVLSDALVEALSTTRPAELAELARVPGLGPTRQRRWGEELLALIADHSNPAGR